mgnify:CR=1 FL=1
MKPDFSIFYNGSGEDIFSLMIVTVGIAFLGTTIGTITDAEGNRTPKYRFVGGEVSRNDLLSRWRMQVGVRVVF